MRKIIVISMITLDGVMQAPGGSKEDTSEGFQFGGWTAPFFDESTNMAMDQQMAPSDLLLGRKTYDIFASYWPQHADMWPGINEVTKYVLSNTRENSDWQNTVFLKSLDDIKKLKNTSGSDLKVWGSSQLIQLLLKNDLVDELWLDIYPVTLGQGKKIFSSGTIPKSFKLTESVVTDKGVIVAHYQRTGEVQTGEIEA